MDNKPQGIQRAGSSSKEVKFEAPDFTGFPINEEVANLAVLVRYFSLTKQPVDTAPTNPPKNFYESIVYYVNGSTHRVYFYTTGWHYILLT